MYRQQLHSHNTAFLTSLFCQGRCHRIATRASDKTLCDWGWIQSVVKQRALAVPAGSFETWHRCAWLIPPRASWKNPPHQVEAEPLEALHIHQLQSREPQVRFRGRKNPLARSNVNVKDKQDRDIWHLSLACFSRTPVESEVCFFSPLRLEDPAGPGRPLEEPRVH